MKKVLALIMVLALALSFTACGGSAKKVKTGIAIVSSYTTADATADAAGNAQVDSTVAAVTYDKDGKITSTVLNCTQAKMDVTAEGVVTARGDSIVPKQEQGDDYGMRAASAIGKEWNEQADAFAAYLTGKTAAEVSAIGVTGDHNAPDVADLSASCTMNVLGFIDAVGRAMA